MKWLRHSSRIDQLTRAMWVLKFGERGDSGTAVRRRPLMVIETGRRLRLCTRETGSSPLRGRCSFRLFRFLRRAVHSWCGLVRMPAGLFVLQAAI